MATRTASPPAKTGAPMIPGATLLGVAVNMVPSALVVPLMPAPGDTPPASVLLKSPYHPVERKRGLLVSVTNTDTERNRLLRLSVSSSSPGFAPEWVRWTGTQRGVSDSLGGASVAAQDTLSPDGTVLTLLLLPGENRTATLEFDATLAGNVRTGDYPFLLNVADPESGDVRVTEGTLRLQHPASSLLTRLPSIYQEAVAAEEATGESGMPLAGGGTGEYLTFALRRAMGADGLGEFREAAFFARFLRGFEDTLDPLNTAIGRLHLLFGHDTAPAEFLPWLGSWLGLVLDETWPELRRRLLLKEAVELYRWRGTRRGLSRYLEIYSGVKPVIYDQPVQGMRLGDPVRAALAGTDTRLGNIGAHQFVVILAVPDVSQVHETTIRAIIDTQKPAHTRYRLSILPTG